MRGVLSESGSSPGVASAGDVCRAWPLRAFPASLGAFALWFTRPKVATRASADTPRVSACAGDGIYSHSGQCPHAADTVTLCESRCGTMLRVTGAGRICGRSSTHRQWQGRRQRRCLLSFRNAAPAAKRAQPVASESYATPPPPAPRRTFPTAQQNASASAGDPGPPFARLTNDEEVDPAVEEPGAARLEGAVERDDALAHEFVREL